MGRPITGTALVESMLQQGREIRSEHARPMRADQVAAGREELPETPVGEPEAALRIEHEHRIGGSVQHEFVQRLVGAHPRGHGLVLALETHPRDRVAETGQKLLRIAGFRQVIGCAEPKHRSDHPELGFAGQHDGVDRRVRFGESGQHVEAAEARHVEVENQDRELAAQQVRQCAGGVRARCHPVTVGFEQFAHARGVGDVVVEHEDRQVGRGGHSSGLACTEVPAW